MEKTDIFIVGVGGQGSLSASWFIGEAAMRGGLKVLVGEVHGMAQRGGIVESTVRIGDVHGPIIDDGAADVLLGFEPVETLRYLHKAAPSSLVITNTRTTVPPAVSISGGTYPDIVGVLDVIRGRCERVITLDATELASREGNAQAINAVMLGVLAGAGALPFDTALLEAAILERVPKRTLEINRRAFAAGLALGGNAPA